ncbi:MAG: glycosyltransferase [Thermoplasmata archaeon]|nr:glycosyltransferase [Thermoplasmata archaeon]
MVVPGGDPNEGSLTFSPRNAPESTVSRDDDRACCDLSVIVIARNEEENIGDCLSSILVSLEKAGERGLISTWEVILSDSASEDRTVEIASKFPVGIVRLSRTWPLSAGAGRSIGFSICSGSLVLFVDGDCILQENWLPVALKAIGPDDVAGVDGNLVHMIDKGNFFHAILKESESSQAVSSVGEVDTLGQALFKRDAIQEVGGYNPFLKGGEDRDIAYRLRREGYRILRVPEISVHHRWAGKKGNLRYFDILKSTFYWAFGDGQATRWNFSDRSIRSAQRERYLRSGEFKGLFPASILALLLCVNLLAAFTVSVASVLFALAVDLLTLLGILLIGRHKRFGFRRALYESFSTTPYLLIRFPSFFLGFCYGSKNPDVYPKVEPENIVQAPVALELGNSQKDFGRNHE